jgi:hypothetical protein
MPERRSRALTILLVIAAACGGDDGDETTDAALADSLAGAMAAASADSANRAAMAGLRAYFDDGPLAAGATREQVRSRFGEPREVRVETEPNRHVPDAVDSLFHMLYDDVEVTLREAQSNTLLERVVVHSNVRMGGAPPLIGASESELRERFGEPEGTPEGHFLYRCETCSQLGGNVVIFRLGKGGTVEAIEIHHPVD